MNGYSILVYAEVINHRIIHSNVSHILFDFDGTLSLIRAGWQDVMRDYFESELMSSINNTKVSQDDIKDLVLNCINNNTGKQTIYQCIELADLIRRYGGVPLDIWEYKEEYQKRLLRKIRYRLDELSENPDSKYKYLLSGSLEFLEMLQKRGIKLFLASGTDEEDVKNEAKLLGIDRFFGNNIFGAKKDYKRYSKKEVVNNIICNYKIEPLHLLGIGDGYVEIENVKQAGGFTCAVCSDESGNGSINKWKYERLKRAGADMFIPDYRDIKQLENILF